MRAETGFSCGGRMLNLLGGLLLIAELGVVTSRRGSLCGCNGWLGSTKRWVGFSSKRIGEAGLSTGAKTD